MSSAGHLEIDDRVPHAFGLALPYKVAGLVSRDLQRGYAPGVGKTYNMLSEAIRRQRRGKDVVIDIIETHGRTGVPELAAQLAQVLRCQLEYKVTVFDEMDVDAIIERTAKVDDHSRGDVFVFTHSMRDCVGFNFETHDSSRHGSILSLLADSNCSRAANFLSSV